MSGTYFVSTTKPIQTKPSISIGDRGVYPEEAEAREKVNDISEYICYRNIGHSHQEALEACKPKTDTNKDGTK